MARFPHAGAPASVGGPVVALGNFDGVHHGHRGVVAVAVGIARRTGAGLRVVTFEPHPRQVLAPSAAPFRLTPAPVKTRELKAIGAPHVLALPFDRHLASLRAETFVEEVLVGRLSASHVVTGWDFRFGRHRLGDSELLRALGRRHGFGVTIVPAVADALGQPYSSTRVRELLRAGAASEAARLLGRPWRVEGRLEATGGRLVAHEGYLLPAPGVYGVRLRVGDDAGSPGERLLEAVVRCASATGPRLALELPGPIEAPPCATVSAEIVELLHPSARA